MLDPPPNAWVISGTGIDSMINNYGQYGGSQLPFLLNSTDVNSYTDDLNIANTGYILYNQSAAYNLLFSYISKFFQIAPML